LTGIVLQARMGSSRLPGKVMRQFCGRPMLGHIIDRLKRVKNSDALIVATTEESRDDIIESFAVRENVACFRGNERDVLSRYYRVALQFKLATIVRATADNPLVDPVEIERLIELHLQSKADYTHAFGKLPVGIGAECFTLCALERSWREGHEPNHREHVNEFIQERPLLFHIEELDIPSAKIAPHVQLTVDTQDDFDRMTRIYEKLYCAGAYITTEDAIGLCGSS
jgi:spore coat polysaccharide biosynthesis protein SpsF